MTVIQISRAYPLKPRELMTKKDKNNRVFKFQANVFVFTDHKTVRVMGQDAYGAWCQLDFKVKNAPGWLRRGIRDVEVSSQA